MFAYYKQASTATEVIALDGHHDLDSPQLTIIAQIGADGPFPRSRPTVKQQRRASFLFRRLCRRNWPTTPEPLKTPGKSRLACSRPIPAKPPRTHRTLPIKNALETFRRRPNRPTSRRDNRTESARPSFLQVERNKDEHQRPASMGLAVTTVEKPPARSLSEISVDSGYACSRTAGFAFSEGQGAQWRPRERESERSRTGRRKRPDLHSTRLGSI